VSAFDFYAIDPVASSGYGNSTFAVSFLPGVWNPHDGFAKVRSTMGAVAKAFHATAFDVKAVKVGGATAYRIRMTAPFTLPDGTKGVMRQDQLQFVRGTDETVVGVSAANNSTGRALVNGLLASVRRT
jgi:hypothetical protein